MTTAFVLTGGNRLGAVQAGMAEVLIEAGIEPDLIIGSSVGALNGAWLASHPGVEGPRQLRQLWLTVRRRDIFPLSPLRVVGGLVGRLDHTVGNAAFARWMSVRASFYRLEQAAIPLYVMATDLLAGTPVVLSTGDVIEALLASAAIPGVFPPVLVDGRWLVDGGLAGNTPVGQAIELGADEVYVLPTVAEEGATKPRSAAGVARHSMARVLGSASLRDVRANAGRCTLWVVPAPPSIGVSPFDFRRGRELMDLARATTGAWMATRSPVAAVSALPLLPVATGTHPTVPVVS